MDTDGDGQINRFDADDDGDGIPTRAEVDADRNGTPDKPLPDTDGDGVPDYLEPAKAAPAKAAGRSRSRPVPFSSRAATTRMEVRAGQMAKTAASC